MNTIKFIILFISLVSLIGCESEVNQDSTISTGEEKFYPPKYPWHLADVWWQASNETENFNNLSIDFEVIGEIDNQVDLYIAPMGLGSLNDIHFYGGIQTNTGGWESKESRERIEIGRGAIFSRWSKDDQPISLDHAQGNSETYFESAGYEGEFVSVRTKISWSEGKYTFSIRKLENNSHYAWFGAFVFSHKKNKEFYIGSLKFEGSTFIYGKKHAAFVEVYGNESCIPEVTVVFYEPKINGKSRKIDQITVNYPNNDYQSNTTPRFAHTQSVDNTIIVTTIPSGLNDGITSEEY